jgi:anaerobic selenocysteine-containing dehydrogenase
MTSPVEHQSYCRICVAACGITVTVEGDRVTKVRGDATHPVSHGYVCSKGRGIPAWHHSEDRLDHPRVRGVDGGWDDAFDDLAHGLQEIIDADGPDAIGIYIATGMAYDTAGTAISGGWLRSIRSRSLYSAMTVDNAPVMVASELVTGHPSLNPVFSPDIPGLLVLVGHNPVVSHGYGTALPDPVTYLRRFRAGGGTMWVLDPRRTESATLADAHLAIRPGGDVAVLAALARELLIDGADADELAHHCDPDQVDALRAALARFTLERAAVAADVELELLERLLADIRAHPGQLNLIAGTGVQMSGDGILVAWLRWVLLILNGSLDKPDGMHFHDGLMPRGRPANPDAKVRPGPPSRPDMPRVVHQVPMVALVDEIEAGNLRALIVCGGNPIAACPEPERMRAALEQLDVLVVIDVQDAEIAQLATHALPATGQLERSDISMFSQVSVASSVQFTAAVVEPVAERKPVWWILGHLARRLGGDVLGGADPDAMTDGDFLRSMLAASPIDADVVFANGPHGTAVPVDVGWIRESFLRDGCWQIAPPVMLERLAAHEPPGPGLLLAPRREMGWSNSVRYDRHKDDPVVRMHPTDMEAAGVRADQRCVLASAHGSVEVVVVADERVRRGVVSMTHGHDVSPGSLTSRIIDVDPLTAMPRASGVAVTVTAAPN